MNELAGKEFRYLIGADVPGIGSTTAITVVGYDINKPVPYGISVGYCNLFDEKNSGVYGPYLHTSDTASQYNEGQIDPKGPGFFTNLAEQFVRRMHAGFKYIELDNPDAYDIDDVIKAIDYAKVHGLQVLAKNPILMGNGALRYLQHPNVVGAIVEKDCGAPGQMHDYRKLAGKPQLPVWFVAFGSGRKWIYDMSDICYQKQYQQMSCYFSSKGEYVNSIPLL